MSRFGPALLAILLLLPAPLFAALPARAEMPAAFFNALEPAAGGDVVDVVDGDTLILRDGREIRLVGIQAPKLPLGRAGFEAWPLSPEAQAFLEDLTLGKTLSLGFGGRRGDRHGRVLAHLFDAEGRWIQGEILKAGLARVYSFSDNRALVAEMLALEREARAARRGIWADPYYAVRSAEEAGRWLGGFELVEGRVSAVGRGGRNTYLNFGADWRSDFTIALDHRARRAFEEARIDPEGYEGKRVRVRGWLKQRNGPMIGVTHPEQIEELED
ncbi:thermonuclease family protein [Pelagibius sp. CAU 1746]|uniref:thermonuclease family protein n=1 Tax=Pelagibius sp. CAU 1746 TaxID=3140370 RepID=UPI00325BAE99